MLWQSLFALALASATVAIHAIGTVHIVIPAAGLRPRNRLRPITTLTILVSVLLILHLFEMAVWGAAYWFMGVFPNFETSFYYSLTSYTTVGYGDVLPETHWRLLGPFEATVGVLMLGLSTGVIVAAVQRICHIRLGNVSPPD